MTNPAPPATRLRIPDWMLGVPRSGLPRTGDRVGKRVIVMGGGVAGLVAGYELARAGHDPIVLEAQNRVGGRIKTLREFAPGLYAEAGAMRIPRAHALTLAYCEHFGLEMAPFVMGNPKGLVHIGGVRTTIGELHTDPNVLPFDLRDDERGKTCDQLWAESTADIKGLLDRKGDAAWDEIAADYDQYSLQEFLQAKGWSEGAIEMYGLLNFVEAEMNNAALEELRETLRGAFVDMQTVVGGMDKFSNAFYPPLADRIRFGSEIESFSQDDDGITVHYETGAHRESVRGDYAIWLFRSPCSATWRVSRH